MEVILLADVKKLGKKGECINVSDGYASNYLIPRKLAVRKTEGSVKVLNHQKVEEEKRQSELKAEAEKIKAQLDTIVVKFTAKAQKNGSMAGTISTKEVEKTLKDEYQITIDKRKILDKFTINAFGYTKLRVELYKNVIGTITIQVLEDKN